MQKKVLTERDKVSVWLEISVHVGNCALCPILLGPSHKMAKCSLGGGGMWERTGQREDIGTETWSLVQKDSFFQIRYKNRMDDGGERTARKKQCYKTLYLENVCPP